MNIAILVSGLPPDAIGGAERQAAELAARLARRHAVHVFTRTATVPDALRDLDGCTVVRRSAARLRGVRFVADIARTLWLVGRIRRHVEVVLAYQTVIDGVIGVLAKKLFGIPVVVSVRCDTEYRLDRFYQSRLLTPFVVRNADAVAVQSPRMARELVEAVADAVPADALRAKIFVMPNGVDAAAPCSGGGEVLYVGRLTKLKSVDVLLAAMRRLPGETLRIVGDGPERRPLERAASDLSNVIFTGRLDHRQAMAMLARAKVLVLPSQHEGQPNILMEAMTRGVPVVATDVGGVPDLVEHGRTGWLVRPGDAAAIANAIRAISSDRALRDRLGQQALVEMRRYDWGVVVDSVESNLRRVCARRPLAGTPAAGKS